MRIGVLTTSAAPGLEPIARRSRARELFEMSCVITCDTFDRTADVPVVVRPIKQFESYRNLHAREDYDRETADILQSLRTDFVFLLGYPYVLTEPMLEAFPQRIIAVHDGDLTRRDTNGERRWTGLHAVREAILAGETATRTSMYFVTPDVANGPLFLMSEPYPVPQLARAAVAAGDYDDVRTYANLHRSWMRRSWGALTLQAIEHLTLGEVKLARDTVWIDGVPGPCRHGDPPNMCFELGDTIQRGVPASCPFIRQ